ncbi:MAG: undecaprenyl-diphosphate phosphatase [Candidatus Paracaedibacteraceae bacterium]|nr:undecaprenyl-diphosphate phosphatase [Candidatus Paracaedibacteraceae bacterium]
MSYFEIFVLSLIQGLTEFLPVSSSGHLILVPKLLGWQDQGLDMDVAVHIGTLISVLIYFRQDVLELLSHFFGYVFSGFSRQKLTPETRLGLIIIVATLPAVFIGFGLKKMGMDFVRSTYLIAGTSIFFGMLMWVADRRPQLLGLDKVDWTKGFVIGLAQAIALIPGTSRSGICMTAARSFGFDRVTSARFAFLLSIPAILGAGVLSCVDAIKDGHPIIMGDLVLGVVLSFLFGLTAIHFFIRFLTKHGLMVFSVYRIILGILLLIFA